MRFGVSIPNNQGIPSVRALVDMAVSAEALGYDSVWVSEHLFHASYVAARLGDKPYHEALVVLTAAAVATQRVRLGTSVLVLPWHHPVRLAKQIASLDELSGGRVDLGVGVAQTPDEFANLNVPYAGRGAVADEMIDAMRCLWQEELPSFEGKHFAFSGLRFEPKPVQSRVPILIGGNSARARRRVRECGDGWHAMSQSANELSAVVGEIDGKPCSLRLVIEFSDKPGARAPADRRSLKGSAMEMREMVSAYENAGVEEIIIDANNPDPGRTLDCYRRFCDEVLS